MSGVLRISDFSNEVCETPKSELGNLLKLQSPSNRRTRGRIRTGDHSATKDNILGWKREGNEIQNIELTERGRNLRPE